MKDSIRSTIYYNLTSRISSDISAEFSRYRSQDGKNLGKGYIFSFEGFRKIRAGYPDYTVYTFLRKGNFSEKDEKGIIKVYPFTKILWFFLKATLRQEQAFHLDLNIKYIHRRMETLL